MVIAAGTLKRIDGQERYWKKIEELKQTIKEQDSDLTDTAKSLEGKVSFWSGLNYLSGLLFGTSPFGAPAFGIGIEKLIHSIGYQPAQVSGTDYTYGLLVPGLAYFFSSMISWGITEIMREYNQEKFLKELETQTRAYQNIKKTGSGDAK